MLYNKLYAIVFSMYAFLTPPLPGSVHYVHNSPYSNYQCTDDGTCHIYCNEAEPQATNQYSCSNSYSCFFHCDDKKCGENAWIYGNNASVLMVTDSATAQQCLTSAHVVAPEYGSAYFVTVSKKGFKGMTVHSGGNTNEIRIHCDSPLQDKDDCTQMNVYASTAQYLRIVIGNQLQFANATVECPVDSSYDGTDAAPCVINATNGVMSNITIIAPQGTPNNMYIEGCSSCTNVQIRCKAGYSTYPFDSGDVCWRNPTIHPTDYPFIAPTNNPTIKTLTLSLAVISSVAGNHNDYVAWHVLGVAIIVLVVFIVIMLCVIASYKFFRYKLDNKMTREVNVPSGLHSTQSLDNDQGTKDTIKTLSTLKNEMELTKDFGLSFDAMSTVDSSVGILANRRMETYNYTKYKMGLHQKETGRHLRTVPSDESEFDELEHDELRPHSDTGSDINDVDSIVQYD